MTDDDKQAIYEKIAKRMFPDYEWDLGDDVEIFHKCQAGVINRRNQLVKILLEELA